MDRRSSQSTATYLVAGRTAPLILKAFRTSTTTPQRALMNKLYLTLVIALACGSAHAQREYSSRDARSERRVDACVDDYTRGERVSRSQMRKIEEQCRLSAASSQGYRTDPRTERRDSRSSSRVERQLDSRTERQIDRRGSPPVTPPQGPQGRNLSDTSGAP
jgi:hypothetical protein